MSAMGGLMGGMGATLGQTAGAGGWGSLISSGIGAVTQAFGAYSSAKAEKNNLEFQGWLQDRQKHDLEMQGADRARVGNDQMFRLRLQQAQRIGSQRARIAAHGGSLTEGSHAQILADSVYIHELDANALQSNTDKAVWLIRENARMKGFDADMTRQKARQISPSGAMMTSLTGSFGKLATQWYRLNPYVAESRGDNAQSTNRSTFQETGESVSGYWGA